MHHAALTGLPRRLVRGLRGTRSRVVRVVQRARHGYSWYDVMDFDVYLAAVISGGARQLATRGVSIPVDMTETAWYGVLLTIADGFALKADGSPDALAEAQQARWLSAAELFVRHFADLSD